MLLIRQARVIDPNSSFNNKISDIFIKNGKIEKIAGKISEPKGAKVIDVKNKCISPGWFDMYASFWDPGFEYKEDLESGSNAAKKGGFTGVAIIPETNPVIQSKAQVNYVKNKTAGYLTEVFPYGALTLNLGGKELTEMYDLNEAGAIGFTDGQRPVIEAGVMLRGLQYVKTINSVVLSYPDNLSISSEGEMNESELSARLGMKGKAAIAEELNIIRDIYLAEYTESHIHIAHVSCKNSVDLIRSAKKKGINVTASVPSYQLLLDENYLTGYDSNYKVNPPLRSTEDIKALKKGLKDGTIDAVCSNHFPQDADVKNVEFNFAAPGIINLETSFALANQHSGLDIEQLIEKMAIRPREILRQEVPVIKEGTQANLTVFDPEAEWVYAEKDILSKSKNSPFIGKQLKGKAIAIINKKQFELL